jgi:hypothetical protein
MLLRCLMFLVIIGFVTPVMAQAVSESEGQTSETLQSLKSERQILDRIIRNA